MLLTLVPLFDEKMAVCAYSFFTQRENYLLNPLLLGTAQFDGASQITGLELIQKMGIDTLSQGKEIFVPITLKPIFTELKKPLSECKVAFITAGGIHRKDQTPFNTSGDFSYRVIPFDTPSDMLMVTHGDFDNSDINKDVNAMFPIDRLHELVEEGFIGYF